MADDNTASFVKDGQLRTGSHFMGISIRGWLTWTAVGTVCFNQIAVTFTACYFAIQKGDISLLGSQTSIVEPLYSLTIAAVAFYFGEKKSTK